MMDDAYEVLYGPLDSLHNDREQTYCPGCEHGVLTRLIAKAISDLGLKESAIGVASVGCSVKAYQYYNVDHIQVMHGRAPAICTGIKRARPDLTVYTVQGDGDALAIGLGETISAAIRGEPITVFLLYNISIIDRSVGRDDITAIPFPCTDLAADLDKDFEPDHSENIDTTKDIMIDRQIASRAQRSGYEPAKNDHGLRRVILRTHSRP